MPATNNNKEQMSSKPELTERFPIPDLVQSELGHVQQRIKELLCAPDEQIQQSLEYLNLSPGKMIRPSLVLLSGACVGNLYPEHIDLAAMVELVHRASLLHDDVIDSARMRRGKQTANAVWGNTAAVLLGDFLLTRAFYLGASIQVDGASDLLGETAKELCCGELLQNFWKDQWDISFEQYYQLIEAKTAALFKSSCRFGAMASKASSDQVDLLGQYGGHLGMAFQMTDDLMDIVGTPKEAGKTLGTDLLQGKLTLPVIHWIQQDPSKKQTRIAQLEQGCDEQMLIREMAQSGSLDYAFTQIHHQVTQARQKLEGFNDSPARQSLLMLTDYVADRIKQ